MDEVETTSGGDEPQSFTVEEAAAAYKARREEAAKPEAERTPKAAPAKATPAKTEAVIDDGEEESEPESADTGDGDEEDISAALKEEPTTAPTLEMPPSWGEADKETWAALTPAAQQKLLTREKQRDAGIQKQLSKVQEKEKALEAELARAKQQSQQPSSAPLVKQQVILSHLQANFADVNPSDPNSMARLALESPDRKAAFDVLWNQLGRAVHEQKEFEAQEAQRVEKEQSDFEAARAEELRSLRPELADETKAQQFETAVVGYLVKDLGIPVDRIRHYSANELLITEKAMKYDRALAGLKAKPKAEVPKVVKPGAAGEGGKSDTVVALEKRARKSGKLEDVLALRRAKQAG